MTKLLIGLSALLLSQSASAGDFRTWKTDETMALQRSLSDFRGRPALGAQWNGGASIGWVDQANITGREPLIFGIEYFDYGPLERNLPKREMGAQFIKDKFQRGGIATIVDHMPNFVTGGNSWDKNGEVLDAILSGGAARSEFFGYLDRLAIFLNSLTVNGRQVPVLLRPFHEMNGTWFWWGDSASGERFVRLWRFYHDYLVREKGVRNVLWVWSPNIERSASVDRYMNYWPGAGYVDVVALDGYDNGAVADFTNASFTGSFDAAGTIAGRFNLPMAFSEVGFNAGAREQGGFWDEGVLPALQGRYYGLSYVLVWNGDWGPREGTLGAEGFRSLASSGDVLMLGDRNGREIYGSSFSGN